MELLKHGGDALEVGVRGLTANTLGGEALERHAQSVDFVDLIKTQLRHRRPPVVLHVDEALLRKYHQRFAHWPAADVQHGCQLFLDKPLPKIYPAGKNGIPNCVRHLVRQHAPTRRTDHGPPSDEIGHVRLSKDASLPVRNSHCTFSHDAQSVPPMEARSRGAAAVDEAADAFDG